MTDIRDGYRFAFHKGYDGRTTMVDVLKIFDPVILPNNLAEVLAEMLQQQHEWYVNKGSKMGSLKELINIVNENKEMDKDVLINCIKFGMEYGDME